MDDSTVPKVYFLNKAETSPIFGKWGCFETIMILVFFTDQPQKAHLSFKLVG